MLPIFTQKKWAELKIFDFLHNYSKPNVYSAQGMNSKTWDVIVIRIYMSYPLSLESIILNKENMEFLNLFSLNSTIFFSPQLIVKHFVFNNIFEIISLNYLVVKREHSKDKIFSIERGSFRLPNRVP